MKDVLFICQGNVGRSQMAEAYYNHFTDGSHAISAGIDNVAEKYGGRPAEDIIRVMAEDGIDIAGQSIKQLQEEMLLGVNRVLILCGKELCPEFLLQNEGVIYQQINDPYQKDIDATRKIRDQIKGMVQTLIEQREKGEKV